MLLFGDDAHGSGATYVGEVACNECVNLSRGIVCQGPFLAQKGLSPYVTPEQVLSYYQAHAGEFGALPQEGPGRLGED